jgi:hypothetical protein
MACPSSLRYRDSHKDLGTDVPRREQPSKKSSRHAWEGAGEFGAVSRIFIHFVIVIAGLVPAIHVFSASRRIRG